MEEQAIVLYPTPLVAHLISMVELGKLILTRQPSLSIHVLTTIAPYDADSTSRYIAAVSAANPSIIFHKLPNITLPLTTISSTRNQETLMFESLRLNNPNVRQALLSISKHYAIHAVVVDFFCSQIVSVASKLNLSVYYFITCGTANLATFLYFPTIHRNIDKSFKDLKSALDIPGLPPIPSGDMPKPILERRDKAYECFLESSILATKTAGIIVNSFEALEPRPLKAISEGLCVPDGPTPPVYCLGPLIGERNQTVGGRKHECLEWLDSQPRKSVVFLCFGSLGLFSKEQLHQTAGGLERSGLRFLWVVRNPPCENSFNLALWSREDPDLGSLLPEGFIDRTRDRGLVVKKWVPQVAVLSHSSVGGFVSHCGWNSILEAVCAGVPIIAWPLYAEQRLNRVMLVEETKIALWMHESESGFVTAAEVEERVRELMESGEGELIRKRMMFMKEEAKAALGDNGSSRVALAKLVGSWNNSKAFIKSVSDRNWHVLF